MTDAITFFAAIGLVCVLVFLLFCICCGLVQISKWVEKLRKK